MYVRRGARGLHVVGGGFPRFSWMFGIERRTYPVQRRELTARMLINRICNEDAVSRAGIKVNAENSGKARSIRYK